MQPQVVVVGSINRDVTVLTPRLPEAGETVLGTGHYTGPGGKGANQAVAAARMGAATALVARLGDDAEGRELRSVLSAEGIDESLVGTDPDLPTGLAVVTVDDEAENTIVVSPGANSGLTPADIEERRAEVAAAGVVLAQLEVPLETVVAAAGIADGNFCLNPAPAPPGLPPELLRLVDVLVPNRTELARLSGSPVPSSLDETIACVHRVEGPKAFVVTLGKDGALVVDADGTTHVEAPVVEAVDPTGAGDAFCGMLAVGLAGGQSLVDAARMAVLAGAAATTRPGALASMPTPADLREAFGV